MTDKNIQIAHSYFQAVQNGDMATLGELLADDIVWHQPGANQFSGDRKGRDAVFAMLGGMMQVSQGSFAIDTVHTLMGNGDLVTATIHFSGRRDDAAMSMDGVDLLRITDGKIVEMWLFSAEPATEDAFWGR
ncbi:nuclear transport factor 2 family protein [Nocardia fluminea]|uniref:nuclear transport factor 2 family protein n=1 Tax=Nocardia fluminea TaxID=134984 RepID=UPI0036566D70